MIPPTPCSYKNNTPLTSECSERELQNAEWHSSTHYLDSFKDETSNMARSAELDEILHIFCVHLSIGSKDTSVWIRVQGMVDSTLWAQVKWHETTASSTGETEGK